MGAYAAVASPVLPESVQDVSSNSKYERMTAKGATAKGTIKVPSTVEYILFPVERHFRHLHEDEGRDAHRFKRYYKEEEIAGKQKGMMEHKKRRDDRKESEEKR